MSGVNLTEGNDSFLGSGLGSGSADSVLGLGGDDTINGAAGADTIFGGSGNDSLTGGTVGDSLNGGEGDDTILPGPVLNVDLTPDRVDGGDGNDWVSYANVSAPASATINLLTGSVSGYASDTLTSIENAIGSAANDSIVGTGAGNWLIGGNGNDTLVGGGGNDTLIGDNGADSLVGGSETDDWASYVAATSGVSVNLAVPAPVASGGAGADSLSGIEGLIGSNFADTLLGDNGSNTLIGGDGSDSLFGGGGNDWLDFGAGDESFIYQTTDNFGNETLIGGDGQDTLDLGVGWTAGPEAAGFINYQRADGTIIFTQSWEQVVCFAEGTRIVSPNGEDAVEKLRAGDMVLAMRDGQAGFEALRWVGFMDVAVPRNAAMAAKTAPVLIKAGALAAGMPARDLRVSPDHAMEVDGHLIPAKHLVNGVSIIQETWCRKVRYFHLELEAHGLLLSEGTWSESYLDDGNRHAFNNAAMTGLFLDFEAGRSIGQYDHQACLPVLRQGLKLDEIHGRILRRAERLAREEKPRRLA
jgi:Ca2+-binding RTX toxin-like protein